MKKILTLICVLLFIPLAWGGTQTTGYHRVNQLLQRGTSGTYAQVVPRATIQVLGTVSGVGATIYWDPGLTSQITPSTVTSDASGNYDYYIPLNYCVDEVVSYPGSGSYTTKNICANAANPSSVFAAPPVLGSTTPNVVNGTNGNFSGALSGTSASFSGNVAATTTKLGNTTALGAGGVTEINNAVAAFGTAYGQVIASPGMAAGVPSILPNNVALFDYRGTQDILNNVTGTQPGNRLPIQQITQNLADFSYVVLAGTVTMTNGSTAVTGTGTTFLTDIDPGRYFGPSIRMSISTSLQWAEVCAVADDTHATLCSNYAGTTATGTAWNLITQMGPTIRATLTAGTPNTLRAGEWVGHSIFGTRTGGERGLYGMNINLNYLTPVQANQGQVQGLEIDYTNSSGVDDPANNGIGLDILSPGGNYGWVGAWIQGEWENGLILQGFRDRGAYLLGSQNHVIMADTACTGVACASDNNVNIEETDNTGTPLWYILNKGFGYFLRGMQLNADLTFPIAGTGIAGPTAAQGIHDDAALGGWNFSTGASATYGYRFWKGAPGGTLLAVLKPSGEFDATASVSAPVITDSGLTAGNCVQAGTGGLLTTVASPCGAGDPYAPVSAITAAGPPSVYFNDFYLLTEVTANAFGTPVGSSCSTVDSGGFPNNPGLLLVTSGFNATTSGAGISCGVLPVGAGRPIIPSGTVPWYWETELFVSTLPATTASTYNAGFCRNAGCATTPVLGFYLSSTNAVQNDWYCTNGVGGNTLTDSGIAAVANTFQRLSMVSDGTTIRFYINGSVISGCNSASTSAYNSSAYMAQFTAVANNITTGVSMDVDYVKYVRFVTR